MATETARRVWRIEMLGRCAARRMDGAAMPPFPTQKTGALLALLAYPPLRSHPRERLIDALWPDADLSAGRNRLNQALSWLRSHLEPEVALRGGVLLTDRLTVGLHPDAIVTDVAEFEAACAASEWERAALLYPGELLPDDYSDWALTERKRLAEAYLGVLRHLTALYERDRSPERALEYARRAVALDPLDEGANADLIKLLIGTGQMAAAQRQFRDLTRRLETELGASPPAALADLIAQTRQGAEAAVVVRSGVAASPGYPALPAPLTRFFGRDREIERLRGMILAKEARLVTLLGFGGAGKTRLALETAARMLTEIEGAAAFVPLADLSDAGLVPAAIADAMNLPRANDLSPVEKIIAALQRYPTLLILDNLEHLLPDTAPLVRELLTRVPTLTVLATSRQRLGLEGEQEMAVPPLPLPPPGAERGQMIASDSVRLFLDRVRAVHPDFAVTDANAATIAAICARLEGMPLAIELCAACARMLSPEQMLERLNRRFELLVSRRTDIPARHRTLRAALEYSYQLLPKELQTLFARLCVFRGGWTVEAAAEICGEEASLDALSELRERSLIVAEDSAGEMRCYMLESLREFAAEQLNYEETTRRRREHAEYFLRLAQAAERGTMGADQGRWLVRLDAEQDNMRAALAWSAESGAIEFGLRLGGALGRYWYIRGYLREGVDWISLLLDRADGSVAPLVLAKAHGTRGHLMWAQGDYPVARAEHEEALRLRREFGDRMGEADSLNNLGITAFRQGDYEAAHAVLSESLVIARAMEDRPSIARALLNLGNIANQQGRLDESKKLYHQSLEIERALGNWQRVADALNNLGISAQFEADYPRAIQLFEDALAIRRELSDQHGATNVLSHLGAIARIQGQWERAGAFLTEGLNLSFALGMKPNVIHYLLQIGLLAAARERTRSGVLLLAAAQHLSDVMGALPDGVDPDEQERALRTARRHMGEAAFTEVWAEGYALRTEEAVAIALAEGDALGR